MLAIDIGNTTIRYCLIDDYDNIIFRYSQDTSEVISETASLRTAFLQIATATTRIESVVISSVVPRLNAEVADASIKTFGLEPSFVTSQWDYLSIDIDNPSELGADLLTCGCAATELLGDSSIVVDLGTATKFTVVYKKKLIGVIIAAGLEKSLKSLFQTTELLKEFPLHIPDRVIGKNTIDSISSGIVFGQIDLIKGIVSRIMDEIGEVPVIVTGGNLPYVEGGMKGFIIEPDLIFKGLVLFKKTLL